MEALIEVFKNTLREKNANVYLFENPDASALGDNEVQMELNRLLREDPDYEVPQEYVKKLEKQVHFVHRLPETLLVDEPYKVSYETFADIVFDILDIHLIEPLSEVYLTAKAVPRVREKPKSRVMDVDSYMKKLERNKRKSETVDENFGNVGHFMQAPLKSKKIRNIIGSAESKYLSGKSVPLKRKEFKTQRKGIIKPKSQQKKKRTYDTTYKTPLRLAIKLEVSSVPRKDRGIAIECGHALEDIL